MKGSMISRFIGLSINFFFKLNLPDIRFNHKNTQFHSKTGTGQN